MATLLHLDSSPMGDASITRRLTGEFAGAWKAAHPEGRIVRRDLAETDIPRIDAKWVGASYAPADRRTGEQREILAASEALIAELEQADEWVLGVPMHNFTVPASLRLWLDQVVRAGRTFAYVEGKPAGLLRDKTVHVFVASGGMYGAESPAAALDFVQPYLRTILGLIGISNIRFHSAGGVAAVKTGQMDRQTFLAPHIDAIRADFAVAA
jgi:FMN-dependent NADH-azoreductase